MMEKLILYKKTKGTEFNSSDEEKFLRRLNQNRVPTYFGVGYWPQKVPGPGVKRCYNLCRPWCMQL